MADYYLIVTRDFGDYRVGDVITDTDAIERVLETNATAVVRVDRPDEVEPVDVAKGA